MVVLVILALLGALVSQNIWAKVDPARVTAAKTDIRSIGTALDLYRLDNFKISDHRQAYKRWSGNRRPDDHQLSCPRY